MKQAKKGQWIKKPTTQWT